MNIPTQFGTIHAILIAIPGRYSVTSDHGIIEALSRRIGWLKQKTN
jgi:hypothetical protein